MHDFSTISRGVAMGRPAQSKPPPIGQVAQLRLSCMSQEPKPTPEEEDAPLERREDEDATRGPAHEDPEKQIDPDPETP
jgi:hypothetical protein